MGCSHPGQQLLRSKVGGRARCSQGEVEGQGENGSHSFILTGTPADACVCVCLTFVCVMTH